MKYGHIANNLYYNLAASVGGIVFTYFAGVYDDLVSIILVGAFWGLLVGLSVGLIFTAIKNADKDRWNAIGYILVVVIYATYRIAKPTAPDSPPFIRQFWDDLGILSFGLIIIGGIFIGVILKRYFGSEEERKEE